MQRAITALIQWLGRARRENHPSSSGFRRFVWKRQRYYERPAAWAGVLAPDQQGTNPPRSNAWIRTDRLGDSEIPAPSSGRWKLHRNGLRPADLEAQLSE